MQDTSIGISSDYISVTFDKGSFYYGYEISRCSDCGDVSQQCDDHPNADQEWCFKAVIDGNPYIYPFSWLSTDSMFTVTENLLAGIAKLFNDGLL